MHNITEERLKSQIAAKSVTPAETAYKAIVETTLSSPISLEELRAALMSELSIPPEKECGAIESIHFENIYDFTLWYDAHRSGFNQTQQIALDTLSLTRNMIDSGCHCRRNSRETMAHDYFAQFWTKNRGTDLLETISKITGAKKVTINVYCVYPLPLEIA